MMVMTPSSATAGQRPLCCSAWGDVRGNGVAHGRASTRDLKTRGSNPVRRSTRTICESFSESECCADSLSVVCPPPVCIRTHKNDHVRRLKILQSMSEFGRLRKRENTALRKKPHKSALLWLLAFPGESNLNFPCIALGQERYII